MNKTTVVLGVIMLLVVVVWVPLNPHYQKQKHYIVIENSTVSDTGVEEWSVCSEPKVTPIPNGYHVEFTDASGSKDFLTTSGVQIVPDGFDDVCKFIGHSKEGAK